MINNSSAISSYNKDFEYLYSNAKGDIFSIISST